MQYIYLKPQLQNLSQGERIAFVRQFRRMTQDEVSDKLGLDGENKRRSMARYESGDRKPKENRLLEIANILKVNPKIATFAFLTGISAEIIFLTKHSTIYLPISSFILLPERMICE